MVDRISFILPGQGLPKLENIQSGLGGTYRGKLENLHITQYPDSRYCSGSLATFLQGENTTTLSRHGIKESLEKLENITGWDLHKAIVRKIEIGCTLPVKEPISFYLKLFNRLPRNRWSHIGHNTLETFTTGTEEKSFIAYNKGIEARGKIPLLFEGCNLIRLEMKIKKGIKKHIGEFSPWDLTDKTFYTLLVSMFKEYYFSIPKSIKPILDISEMKTPKEIDNILKVIGIKALGETRLLETINTLEKSGKLSRADRARASIKNLITNVNYTEPEDLIQELNSKVISFTNYP